MPIDSAEVMFRFQIGGALFGFFCFFQPAFGNAAKVPEESNEFRVNIMLSYEGKGCDVVKSLMWNDNLEENKVVDFDVPSGKDPLLTGHYQLSLSKDDVASPHGGKYYFILKKGTSASTLETIQVGAEIYEKHHSNAYVAQHYFKEGVSIEVNLFKDSFFEQVLGEKKVESPRNKNP